ncbi:MAG: hypothetical protein E7557_02265 [Ruminococcaceae bacterium]|nr:hypothetical protein [Oscillospiraceae bacterium]
MLFGVQWYLWVLLLVVAVLAVFVWIKAMSASKIRREKLKKEAEIWKKDYELRQEFKTLSLEKLNSTPNNKMLSGVCMNIQIFLENETDMNEAFLALPDEKKYIYCLEYFDEDSVKSLSQFFKNNGSPLTDYIVDAIKAVGYGEILPLVEEVQPMYDGDSEVSIDYAVIDKADDKFKEAYNSNKLYDLVTKYVKANKEIFIN